MDKTYSPESIEQRWYNDWEEKGYFKASPEQQGDAYCIMLPPPNVTGTLHMGHAFQQTIMDALTRYRRMKGDNALWQPGTDHAGIATQMVVERQLNANGKTRHDVGREVFLEKIWKWKALSGGSITNQMRHLGTSTDWSRERFTMDEGLSEAVKETFVRLYEEGLLYRGKRLVNWDPKLHTAISDLEVENKDEKGHLWHFRYPLAEGVTTSEGKDYIVVATTRPETMLGDSAVAVHPDDERYQAIIGKSVLLPIVNRLIPIVADNYVDREFGTGCVKITPAHDFNDYEVGKRHQLPLINIMTIDAAIREKAQAFDIDGKANNTIETTLPQQYHGLDRNDARKLIVDEFKGLDLLEKVDDHALKAPYGDRSGVVIEPLLTDQWFVDAKTLAKPALEAVEDGRIRFVPEQYKNMYFSWMRDIQDWCISRQLWWGHRIPAWYDQEGNVYVGRDEAEIRSKHNVPSEVALNQDDDVLDTWFSSALWPFSTLGWPAKTDSLNKWYPTSVLVTGFDIIFFWVARMVMMGIHFMDGKVPFKDVYITGLVRDENGDKMSKSKGNVLDPLDLIHGIELDALIEKRTKGLMQPKMAAKIEKNTRKSFPDGIPGYGTDALRFTLASLASTGRDIKFDLNRMEGYRNFCNKLWNAARYVLSNVEGHDTGTNKSDEIQLSTADKWILSRLQHVEMNIAKHMDEYRFDLASKDIYEFTWNEYCSWYIELAKPVLNGNTSSEAEKRGTRQTLVRVLETILRLAHPIIPFITEEIWQQLKQAAGVDGDSIMVQTYPTHDNDKIDTDAEKTINWLQEFVSGVRQIRKEMNIADGKALPVIIQDASNIDKTNIESTRDLLIDIAKLESLKLLDAEAPESATALVGDMKVLIPLAGLIDKEAELARLDKEMTKSKQEFSRLSGKLSNANFIDKAPEAVVNKEKEKLAEIKGKLANFETQKAKIAAL